MISPATNHSGWNQQRWRYCDFDL